MNSKSYYLMLNQKNLIGNKNEKYDLTLIISNKCLGNFYISETHVITKEEFLKAIKDKNPSAKKLTLLDFDLQNQNPNEITIIGRNKYYGQVKLLYQINNFSPFFKIKEISEEITTLFINDSGTVYVGTTNNTVYKSDGTSDFIPMKGNEGSIKNLIVDQKNNVYVICNISEKKELLLFIKMRFIRVMVFMILYI